MRSLRNPNEPLWRDVMAVVGLVVGLFALGWYGVHLQLHAGGWGPELLDPEPLPARYQEKIDSIRQARRDSMLRQHRATDHEVGAASYPPHQAEAARRDR